MHFWFSKIRAHWARGQVRPTPLIPRQLSNWELKKVQDKNIEVNLVSKSFLSGLQQKKQLGYKLLRLLSDEENKADPIH